MVGLDLAERAVAHCNATHGRDRLDFRAGDAENLPFADGSFDAVLNVESSHCYPDITKFFAEVARVLRPGGYLLMADLRPSENTEDFSAVDELRGQIEAAGLEIVDARRHHRPATWFACAAWWRRNRRCPACSRRGRS